MTLKNRLKKIAGMAAFLILCGSFMPVAAHNLWVIGNPDGSNSGMFDLYFEHGVKPGTGEYNGPIAERGKTWLRTTDGKSKPLALREVKEGAVNYFKGKIESVPSSYAIDHTSLYGIYHGQLDFFHGIYIEIQDLKDLPALADSPNIPVRIVPEWHENGLLISLMYFQHPCPNSSFSVFDGSGKEQKLRTDKKGQVLLKDIAPGRYHMVAWVIEQEAAGEFEYQAYKGLMHGTTLTLQLHPEQTGDPN